MGLDLKEWNAINGLSPTLIKNLTVGMMIMLMMGWGQAEYRAHRANERTYETQNARIEDQKEFKRTLLKEKETADSLKQSFMEYLIKLNIK